MTDYLLPVFIGIILLSALLKKTDCYACFLVGAADGLRAAIQIAPALTGLLAAVGMMRESGLAAFLVRCLSPVASVFSIPGDLLPLMLLRPVSGSGSLALVADLMNRFGVDSGIALTAAVMMGSTETTLYAISVYQAAAGVKQPKSTLAAALIADAVGMGVSVLLCR